MGTRKKADWHFPFDGEKIIKRHFADGTVILYCNASGKTNTKTKIKHTEHIAICYSIPSQAYIVWNASIHRFLHKSSITFDCGTNARRQLQTGIANDEIVSVYKNIVNSQYQSCVEKILLVGKEALFEFCQHYEDYLYPIVEDIPIGKFALYSTPEMSQPIQIDNSVPYQAERSRIAATRTKRDPEFRRKILAKYNFTCIICGSTEERQLQAAHIQSVKSGGTDSEDNGYCLCANHHLLYDAGLLDINFANETFVCHSTSEKQAPWYQAAIQNGFKLILKGENI